jgi:hypothetical protein
MKESEREEKVKSEGIIVVFGQKFKFQMKKNINEKNILSQKIQKHVSIQFEISLIYVSAALLHFSYQ